MNEKAKVSRVMNSSEFKNKLSETNGNEFLREFWKVQGTHTEVQLQQYVEDRNTKLSGEAEYEQASLEMETVAELIRLSVLAETMAAENYTAANKELNLAHKELCIFCWKWFYISMGSEKYVELSQTLWTSK